VCVDSMRQTVVINIGPYAALQLNTAKHSPTMLRVNTLRFATASRRFVATATKTETATKTASASATATATETTALQTEDPLDVIPSSTYPQAPNRAGVWSDSQRSRDELYKTDPRFVGKDLSKQPQALAAIELIKQQPISYIHGNIAVCHGTDFVQGHPKVYINLDKEKSHTCGYCGARYAREELKGKL
jgi:NADH dehydrogenase (ubiquinone) Fe-S protein 6